MKLSTFPRRGLFVLAMTILLSAFLARGAEPAATSAPAGEGENAPRGKTPQYAVPYAPPTAEQIKQVIDRVRDRLDAGTGSRIVDRKTHEPAGDLSKPADVALDSGPEHNFGP